MKLTKLGIIFEYKGDVVLRDWPWSKSEIRYTSNKMNRGFKKWKWYKEEYEFFINRCKICNAELHEGYYQECYVNERCNHEFITKISNLSGDNTKGICRKCGYEP